MTWRLFTNPMTISFKSVLWLILPLCAAVGIVYKTVRTQKLRRLPWEIVSLLAYMAAGLTLLAVSLWLIQRYWP